MTLGAVQIFIYLFIFYLFTDYTSGKNGTQLKSDLGHKASAGGHLHNPQVTGTKISDLVDQFTEIWQTCFFISCCIALELVHFQPRGSSIDSLILDFKEGILTFDILCCKILTKLYSPIFQCFDFQYFKSIFIADIIILKAIFWICSMFLVCFLVSPVCHTGTHISKIALISLK